MYIYKTLTSVSIYLHVVLFGHSDNLVYYTFIINTGLSF